MNSRTSTRSRRAVLGTGMAMAAVPFIPRLATATPIPQATPAPSDTLSAAIQQAMTDHFVPGCVVSLEQADTEPWLEAFGLAEIETGEAMSVDHHFRIGSITKTFTATVILQLVDDGDLALDDPVSDFRTDIPNGDEMTLRHLLGMRSGIFNLTDDESLIPSMLDDPTRPWTTEELLQVGLAHDPDFAPGEQFAYSNTNYVLLQLIAEQVTGSPLADEIRRRVLSPVGLTNTSWPTGTALPDPFAHGYVAPPPEGEATPGAAVPLLDFSHIDPSIAAGAGAMQSTAGDLRAWLHTLIDGTLLSEDLQQERLTFPPAEKQGQQRYGLGIAYMDGWIGHDGSILGYQGYMGYDPESGTSLVVLANIKPGPGHSNPANEIAHVIQESLGQL